MACQSSPTATLFGTTVVSTNSASSSVSTEFRFITSDSVVAVPTCSSAVVGNSTTCVPTTLTSHVSNVITSEILHTTVVNVPVVSTITNPTQTLFGSSCDNNTPPPRTRPDTTVIVTTTAKPDDPTTPPTPTPTTSSSSAKTFLAPVTLTHTYTSTDSNGSVVVAVSEDVSTPTADSNGSSNTGSTNLPAIIGGVVGGIVGLIALIAIIWFIMYKKRSGRWDDIWEEDDGHQAGAAEFKGPRPAANTDGSSPNPYVYGAVGRGTPSPLLRADQRSTIHSHSRSASSATGATGYLDHARTSSNTPLMLATSPPHSPPNSPPSLHPPQLPGALERRGTPVWASHSAQQGYFHQGYPPIPSDPNFAPTPTLTSSYSTASRATSTTASSTQGLLGGYVPPARTAGSPPPVSYPPGAAPPVLYPPGAAPPIIGGGRRSTYSDYKAPLEKPPLEKSPQGAHRPPSSQYTRPSTSSTINLMDAPNDNVAEFHPGAAGFMHTPSIRYDKGGSAVMNSIPTGTGTAEPPSRTSTLAVPPTDVGRTSSPAPIVEEAPPAYEQ